MSIGREIKAFDNNAQTYDLTETFRQQNQGLLKNYGRDISTYNAENHSLNAEFWAKYEARMAHGYPYTAWLQLGLVYAAGIYTAQEQGCIKKSVFFSRFWRFHYFDWLTFLRRGGIYGWAGGLVAGTVLFGNPNLSLRRAISKYHYYFSTEIQDNNFTHASLMIKQN